MNSEKPKKNSYNKQPLPFKCENLENPQNYLISKQKITLHYTKYIREDITNLMKEKQIGWTEICRKLKCINYNYNPISLQLQIKGKSQKSNDINYFIPILILLLD